MDRAQRAALVFAVLAACQFERTRQPGVAVEVLDETGAPVPQARVVLVTADMPHDGIRYVAEGTTDGEGRVQFDRIVGTESGCACLPHGVPVYYYVVCGEAPGRNRVARTIPEDATAVELALPPASTEPTRACDVNDGMNAWLNEGHHDAPPESAAASP